MHLVGETLHMRLLLRAVGERCRLLPWSKTRVGRGSRKTISSRHLTAPLVTSGWQSDKVVALGVGSLYLIIMCHV